MTIALFIALLTIAFIFGMFVGAVLLDKFDWVVRVNYYMRGYIDGELHLPTVKDTYDKHSRHCYEPKLDYIRTIK